MKIIEEVDKMKTYARIMKKGNKLLGFVPTMGYLHQGHLNLIRTARKQCDALIISIFVNPIQFGRGEDFEKYPRDIKKDEELCKEAGVDALFCPKGEDMFPKGFSTYMNVEVLTENLCGKTRPGHFRGVTTVVTKLFEIVRPDIAYFGQKDAQQAIVITKMVEDMNMDVLIKTMPTVREDNGLAMSSRNSYLKKSEKKEASVLAKSLNLAESMINSGETDSRKIIKKMRSLIEEAASVKIDYVSIVDTKSLKNVDKIKGEVMIALAAFIGKTRLIDNIIINTDNIGVTDSESGQKRPVIQERA